MIKWWFEFWIVFFELTRLSLNVVNFLLIDFLLIDLRWMILFKIFQFANKNVVFTFILNFMCILIKYIYQLFFFVNTIQSIDLIMIHMLNIYLFFNNQFKSLMIYILFVSWKIMFIKNSFWLFLQWRLQKNSFTKFIKNNLKFKFLSLQCIELSNYFKIFWYNQKHFCSNFLCTKNYNLQKFWKKLNMKLYLQTFDEKYFWQIYSLLQHSIFKNLFQNIFKKVSKHCRFWFFINALLYTCFEIAKFWTVIY